MKTAIATPLLLAVSVFAAAQQSTHTDLSSGIPYPILVHADVPFYPPVAWSAHFGGVVEIEVTVKDGKVIQAHVQRVKVEQGGARETRDNSKLAEYLSVPSLENVKTWRFVPDGIGTFVVTYAYRLEGTETPLPENPTVFLDLPRSITVTARPFKPTTTP